MTVNVILPSQTQLDVFAQITTERKHQDDKWGVGPRKYSTLLLALMEEVGEAAEAMIDKRSTTLMYGELIQVAAVAVKICEQLIEHPYHKVKEEVVHG
tara:strand:+ start:5000 stop:5293 length:294 start_codon:yes stop_codon:yes gene_type:complete